MKDFGDFMDYFSDHISEVSYDTVQIFKRQRFTGITLSQDDVTLVTEIAQQNALAILRQYHAWMLQSSNNRRYNFFIGLNWHFQFPPQ